jgi:hypothetical protein
MALPPKIPPRNNLPVEVEVVMRMTKHKEAAEVYQRMIAGKSLPGDAWLLLKHQQQIDEFREFHRRYEQEHQRTLEWQEWQRKNSQS